MPILITGHPRSATGYMAKIMQSAGIEVGHEKMMRDGISSWMHIQPAGDVSWAGKIKHYNYDHIIHIVRDPIDVIASSQTLSHEAWSYFSKIFGKLPDNIIERAMTTWIKWNNLINKKAKSFFMIENIEKDWPALMKKIGYCAEFPAIQSGYNARAYIGLKWSDLDQYDRKIVSSFKSAAKYYGYETIDKQVTISACMIVRDEEKNLDRCLSSIVDVVDEIIIVDTGSTDNTVKIAEKYGAKIYHSPWQDDFSFHRNESIGYATCDWILRIDADEELIIKCNDLRDQLARIPSQCVMTRNLMEDMQNNHVAMTFYQNHFFRRGHVKYVNRKHNMPVFDGSVWHLHGVITKHYGYNQETLKKKEKRDKELLAKMMDDSKNDYQILFWLGQTYGHYDRDYRKSMEYLEKYIEIASEKPDFNRSAYVSISEMALNCGEKEKSSYYIKLGIEKYPDNIDLNFLMIKDIIINRRKEEVGKYIETYLKSYEGIFIGKSDGRFTWFANKNSLVWVLHKAVINYFFKGISYLELFRKNLTDVSTEVYCDITKCMNADLEKLGIDINLFEKGSDYGNIEKRKNPN